MRDIKPWQDEKARRKITNHLYRCGHRTDFEISHHMMWYWWKYLNIAVFNSELSIPIFKPVKMFYREGHTYGMCERAVDGTITIKMDYLRLPKDLGRVGFITVLVHEMVHQYQFEHKCYPGHGKTFENWANIIEHRLGLTLTETIDANAIKESYELSYYGNNSNRW